MNETATSNTAPQTPKRYHPALVTLHWVIVLLVFTNLFIGLFEFEPALRSGGAFRIPEGLLAFHMAVGITILVLLIVRFIVRLSTPRPAPADAGSKPLNVLARLVHYALYLVVFATTVVGLIFALQTQRLQRAFLGGGGGPRFGQGNGGFQGGNGFGQGNGGFRNFPTPGPGTPFPSFGNGGNGFGNQPGGNPGFQGNGNGFRPRGGFGAAFILLPVHLYTWPCC